MNECSMINHTGQKSMKYCDKCKIFMCHQCLVHHKALFHNHNLIDLTQDNKNLFIGICQENNHLKNSSFFVRLIINYVVYLVQKKMGNTINVKFVK